MHLFFDLGFINLPAYGTMIALGLVLANVIAAVIIKKKKMDFDYFILLEAYCLLGAFIGAKGLYLIVSFNDIKWSMITDPAYFNEVMLGGFVFYGGLIGGLLAVLIAGKAHKIDYKEYIVSFVGLIPFIHAFGRLGCFCAGCCYGMPYDGPGYVIFPEGSFAIPNVKLFPVQLVEAGLLLIISLLVMILRYKKEWKYTIETYLLLYAVVRFILEYVRYDAERGMYGIFSTSQWISILLFAGSLLSIFIRKKHEKA